MVKTSGPAMSEEASKTLANLLTFQKGSKKTTVKLHRAPANPKTSKQLSIRAMVGWISSEWKNLPDAYQQSWEPLAAPDLLANYHAYVKFNAQRWRHFMPPSLTYPPIVPPPTGGLPGIYGYNHRLSVLLAIYWTAVPAPYAFTLHVSQHAPFNPAFENCIGVATRAAATTTYQWVQVQTAGTYYFRVRGFSHLGNWTLPSTTFAANPTA